MISRGLGEQEEDEEDGEGGGDVTHAPISSRVEVVRGLARGFQNVVA